MTGAIGVFIVLLAWRFVVMWAAAVYEAVGLDPNAARFEARSALTGSGYTTSQSERVVHHPVTRRVASTLMIAGYLGPATILALLGVSFVLPPDGEAIEAQVIVLVVLCTALFALDRIGAIRAIGSRPARALAARMTRGHVFEAWTLIGDQAVATLTMPDDPALAEAVAAAVRGPEVTLLAVTAAGQDDTEYATGGRAVTSPGPADQITIFGPGPEVERLRALLS